MKYIWYEQLLNALRLHIGEFHMIESGALDELRFTEEHLAYSRFEDEEIVTIGCPWSIHCKCKWEVEGKIEFQLVEFKNDSS
jgi:hypothetical protein